MNLVPLGPLSSLGEESGIVLCGYVVLLQYETGIVWCGHLLDEMYSLNVVYFVEWIWYHLVW